MDEGCELDRGKQHVPGEIFEDRTREERLSIQEQLGKLMSAFIVPEHFIIQRGLSSSKRAQILQYLLLK
jgi:hypothetical protein